MLIMLASYASRRGGKVLEVDEIKCSVWSNMNMN